MDKKIIKTELKSLINEASVSGSDATKKAQNTSKEENKSYYKDVEKKMSEYDKNLKKEDKDKIDPVKFPAEGKNKEYHEDMEIMNGQEMIEYATEPNDTFKDRAKKAIEGDSSMGNETYVDEENGNTEPVWGASDEKFGEKLVDRANKSKEKRDAASIDTYGLGDDIESLPEKSKVVNKNKKPIATESMKRICFKKPFNGVGNALKLIPEAFKIDNKQFEMTDGTEKYKIKWLGSLTEGKAIIIEATSKDLVNEQFNKIKHLMNYKSENTLGNLDGNQRINENNLIKKTK